MYVRYKRNRSVWLYSRVILIQYTFTSIIVVHYMCSSLHVIHSLSKIFDRFVCWFFAGFEDPRVLSHRAAVTRHIAMSTKKPLLSIVLLKCVH